MYKFFLLFLFLTSVGLQAQSDSLVVKNDESEITIKKFDRKHLNSYKKDSEFQYNEEIVQQDPSFLDRFGSWALRKLADFVKWILGDKYASSVLKNIVIIFPYVVAGLVLFLLFKFFMKVGINPIISQTKNKATVAYTEEEELIKNKDLAKLIKQAIEQHNLRLAIRYYYLLLLQQLQEVSIIQWEQQKTNDDYSSEIKQVELKKSFKKLTKLYDFVWYGNFEINEIEFEKAVNQFQQTQQLIQKK